MRVLAAILGAGFVVLFGHASAWAACNCASGDVTDCCSITEAYPAAFPGAISPFTTEDVWTSTLVTVSCTCDSSAPVAVLIGISGGQSNDPIRRQMEHALQPTTHLDYDVASSYTSTTEWGDGTLLAAETFMVIRSATVPVFFRIPAGKVRQALVGSYRDELLVQVLSATW